MSEQLKKAVRDRDLTRAFISGIAAAIIMSYVTSVAKPSIIHLVLALIAVCAIVAAFLLVARSKIDAAGMVATVIGTALVGVFLLIRAIEPLAWGAADANVCHRLCANCNEL